jgi:Fe-S-cluster containining protein
MRALEAADPFQGYRCSFLQADGACGIYELRPVVCRSHGLPLQFKDLGEAEGEDLVFRDVCYLNFQAQDISALPPQDVLNLDTLNTLLAMLNRMSGGGEERMELTISALLGP